VENGVILVEGLSDQAAIEALAERQGLDLGAEGISVVPIGGAQAITRYLERFRAARLAGLCDEAEAAEFRRGLERAGFGSTLTRPDMERLGFFVCETDLEDELIRAVGPADVLRVAEQQGDLPAFRTLQKQPSWRGRPVEDQLKRWLGSGGRRKIRYARLLVEAVAPEATPRPLARVLQHVVA
jgi:hypothetical protein